MEEKDYQMDISEDNSSKSDAYQNKLQNICQPFEPKKENQMKLGFLAKINQIEVKYILIKYLILMINH